ncbi:hypothetical protein ACTQ50_02180 [Blautia sp. Sow4_E7]|uniref:hypothetical protein n=1 Tax=Blautia sp. Sow4_E7 TaxID=3438749 RepID=UPI003F90B8C5
MNRVKELTGKGIRSVLMIGAGFTGAIAYFATGKMWAGVLGILFHAAVIYKLGDLWAPY